MQWKAWLELWQGQKQCDSSKCWAALRLFQLVRPDQCSLLREAAGPKLEGVGHDLFCHNKAIKTGNDGGGAAIVLVEIPVPRHGAGVLLSKGDPLQPSKPMSFFTVAGRVSVPATLHARPASVILHKLSTGFLWSKRKESVAKFNIS